MSFLCHSMKIISVTKPYRAPNERIHKSAKIQYQTCTHKVLVVLHCCDEFLLPTELIFFSLLTWYGDEESSNTSKHTDNRIQVISILN